MAERTIRYYSTNGRSPVAGLEEALLKGLAPDGGLYMPESIPVLSIKDLESFRDMEYHEIACSILGRFTGNDIDNDKLASLCREAYDFDIPIEQVTDRSYIMRLDQGPTASFKDFAARMMSRMMQFFLARSNRKLTILTATSGDTGSAVASAFYGLENISVVILFPEKEVTPMQRKQMTTLQKNIKIIAIKGKFDDCQRLVKEAFLDPALSGLPLTSANSINIGRLLPQSVYYFYAWSRLSSGKDDKAVFSVPSGNFGNLMGGLLAREMGLPVDRFVISTNENDEVPLYLKTGTYTPVVPSRNCISSAMNVGHPSNLSRIVALYGGSMDEKGRIISPPDIGRLRNDLFAVSVSDIDTKQTIEEAYKRYGIILEPHGATAWRGLTEYLKEPGSSAISDRFFVSLETAHPSKFPEEILEIIGVDPEPSPSLKGLEKKQELFTIMENDYVNLREFLLKND